MVFPGRPRVQAARKCQGAVLPVGAGPGTLRPRSGFSPPAVSSGTQPWVDSAPSVPTLASILQPLLSQLLSETSLLPLDSSDANLSP